MFNALSLKVGEQTCLSSTRDKKGLIKILNSFDLAHLQFYQVVFDNDLSQSFAWILLSSAFVLNVIYYLIFIPWATSVTWGEPVPLNTYWFYIVARYKRNYLWREIYSRFFLNDKCHFATLSKLFVMVKWPLNESVYAHFWVFVHKIFQLFWFVFEMN